MGIPFHPMSMRLDDCVVLHGKPTPRCCARVDKHFVGYGSLQLCSAGAVELWYNSRRWLLGPGWLWPCLPGPQIRFHAAPGHAWWDHRYVAVCGPLYEAWRREGLWPDEPLAVPAAIAAAESFDAIYRYLAEGSAWARRRAVNRLEDLLLALACARGDPQEAPWLARARALLVAAAVPVDVPAVAQDCGLPLSTFRRRFAAATGMSPRDFALTARIDRACDRLLADQAPVADIAAELGYPDTSFFVRQFRQRTGLTPQAYRLSRLGLI
jgi:AraC-like DNA-binding protein